MTEILYKPNNINQSTCKWNKFCISDSDQNYHKTNSSIIFAVITKTLNVILVISTEEMEAEVDCGIYLDERDNLVHISDLTGSSFSSVDVVTMLDWACVYWRLRFYLHRLLLLFTFIVFVPVHVLLTLYLEYDLIIIII